MFKYQDYITEVHKGPQVNRSKVKPAFISLLKTDRGRTLFDIRVWINGEPTGSGVYVQDTEAAEQIIEGLKNYIAEYGEQNRRRESITDVLGYNPFVHE